MTRGSFDRSLGGGGRGMLAALALLGALAAGCATTSPRAANDPLEPMNRGIFWFNEQVDRWLLEPIATGYDWVAPERVQRSSSRCSRERRVWE